MTASQPHVEHVGLNPRASAWIPNGHYADQPRENIQGITLGGVANYSKGTRTGGKATAVTTAP